MHSVTLNYFIWDLTNPIPLEYCNLITKQVLEMFSASAVISFSWHSLDHICGSALGPHYTTDRNWNKFSRKPPGWSGTGTLNPCREAEGGGLVQPGEEMGLGGPGSSFPTSWGGYQEDGTKLFTVRFGRRMRSNRHKLKQEKFRLNIRKTFIPVR